MSNKVCQVRHACVGIICNETVHVCSGGLPKPYVLADSHYVAQEEEKTERKNLFIRAMDFYAGPSALNFPANPDWDAWAMCLASNGSYAEVNPLFGKDFGIY